MKICAIICEYNPFHLGHLYHLTEAKKRTGADAVLCVMSGNFVQRGEAAVLGKYKRAKHAVLAGADAVIELPAVFATSCAEIFAKGAVKLLSAVPDVKYLAFGAESAETTDFLRVAERLNNEPKEVSDRIKALTDRGESFVKASSSAWKSVYNEELPVSPNDILGTEYAKAILSFGADIAPVAIGRKGGGYLDATLQTEFPSATAIRAALDCGERDSLQSSLPEFVFRDLPNTFENGLLAAEKLALISKSAAEIKRVLDCTEGLENALKREADKNSGNIVEALTSKRYTASRIRRILLQNLLEIEGKFIKECLRAPLYLNLLAVKKDGDEILSALGKSALPLVAKTNDKFSLTGTARAAFDVDERADKIYAVACNVPTEKRTIF